MIGQGVFINTIASMNCFATSNTACWWGQMLWSPPAIGWGTLWSPPALQSRTTWVGTTSASCNILMVDYWYLNNGSAMAPAGSRRFGGDVCAMTVSARLHFLCSGTFVVWNVSSQHACQRCTISCWWSNKSSWISNDNADSLGTSLSSSLISWSVSSLSCFMKNVTQTLAVSNTIHEGWVGCWIIC